MLIVGDELLSGKRADRHLPKAIELLAQRGMHLDWAGFVGDDEARIAEVLVAARARGEVVLCCGGIGATPDDRTRQAAARAFGVPLERHPEAESLIAAQYGSQAYPNRVLMADFPRGAGLIPNPVNRMAGFYVGDCNFVPGFPEMAWPMLAWVLDRRYAGLHCSDPPVEFSLRAIGSAAEGDLLPLMTGLLQRFPGVSLSSLPFRGDSARPRHIEFGVKGPRALAREAFVWLTQQLQAFGGVQIEILPGNPD